MNENDGVNLITLLKDSLPAIAIALFGGFVDLMTTKEKITDVKFVIGTLLASAFIGIVLCLVLHEMGVSEAIKGAAVGIGGATARPTLAILRKRFLQKIDKETDG